MIDLDEIYNQTEVEFKSPLKFYKYLKLNYPNENIKL